MKILKLNDICKIGSSKRIHLSDYVENGVPFYRSKEIIELSEGNPISEPLFISHEKFSEIKHKFPIPKTNDILITSVGTLGVVHLVKDPNFYFKDGNLTWLREFNENIIDIDFLFYWLNSNLFKKQILNNNIGAVQKAITIDFLKKVDISLPDIPNQQSIAAVLSALDKKIALNKQINARLEEMAKTLYDYWFVQFDFPDANGKPYKSSGGEMVFDETLKREIPKGWEVKSLGEVISLERGVTYSKDSICNDKNGIGILRATNISGNNIDLNDLIYISGEVDTQQKLKPFDILIVMSSGSKEHIGKNGVYYFEQDNAFGAFCSKITPQKVFFEFVSTFLQSNNFRNYVKNQCLGTNINNLNNSHILHCPIVRPNDEYIEAFHKQTKLIYEKISCNVKQNYHLTQLRDFLLPMLMNGQVSVAE